MLSKNKIKFINSLDLKKNRIKHSCFIVEGEKMVLELISSNITIKELYHTSDFICDKQNISNQLITEQELNKISFLKTPNKVLAIAETPEFDSKININELSIVLDTVQDPGNLGTIIRTANWFGINQIYCSHETTDAYNQKVVQATMGAIFRTRITYCDLSKLLADAQKKKLPIYGALLNGNNLYEQDLSATGMIVLGNESKGISKQIECFITHKIKIPNYSSGNQHMESLNVGIANAIILAEFKRR